MKHIVMFSGGAGSWATAKRVVEKHGTKDVVLLFADTNMEDPDLYRFLDECAANIGVPVTRVSDGRTPWDVFFQVRFLGNTRIDPCSRILKREILRRHIDAHFDSSADVVYIGIDWTEEHRFLAAQPHWKPWTIKAPLCDPPYVSKADLLRQLQAEGVAPARLYDMGFPHNNCGGFCIKAGQAHFKLLLQQLPETYAFHEAKEQEIRAHLGKDVAILRDRRGGKTRPLTLQEFRQRIEGETAIDEHDWGGCGCFSSAE